MPKQTYHIAVVCIIWCFIFNFKKNKLNLNIIKKKEIEPVIGNDLTNILVCIHENDNYNVPASLYV